MLGLREYDVAIVGGGLSGCALAAALARCAPPEASIVLIGDEAHGTGAAYRPVPDIYMNGPAREMSALEDDPGDLVRYCGCGPDDLVERSRYGQYAAHVLARASVQHAGVETLQARVTAVNEADGRYHLSTSRNETVVARRVVLATGNPPPDVSAVPAAIAQDARVHHDPWRFDAAAAQGRVAVLGSGLSGLDVAAKLSMNPAVTQIDVISRRALLPLLERPWVRSAPFDPARLDVRSPLALSRSLRALARDHMDAGGDWRSICDSIRAQTPAIWSNWSVRQQRQFLRHAQARWAIHRYRAPQQTLDTVLGGLRNGRIRLHAARIDAAVAGVPLRLFLGKVDAMLDVDALVNCTGPSFRGALKSDPLLSALARSGHIMLDRLCLGLAVTERLQLRCADGTAVQGLYAIGPATRGAVYEATAVPEIRRQARALAIRLSDEIAASVRTIGAA